MLNHNAMYQRALLYYYFITKRWRVVPLAYSEIVVKELSMKELDS